MGLLHKRVLGQAHHSFDRLLPWYSERFPTSRGFGHNKQLYGHWLEATYHHSLYFKSIFKMVDIYNNLPQHVVDAVSVSAFQRALTEKARERCNRNDPLWAFSLGARSGPELRGPSDEN